jgi:hypothetical protein
MNWNDPDEFTHKLCSDFEPDEDEEDDLDSEEDDEEIDEPEEPICLLRYDLVMNAGSLGAMSDSLKQHRMTCAACGRVDSKLRTAVAIVPEAA